MCEEENKISEKTRKRLFSIQMYMKGVKIEEVNFGRFWKGASSLARVNKSNDE